MAEQTPLDRHYAERGIADCKLQREIDLDDLKAAASEYYLTEFLDDLIQRAETAEAALARYRAILSETIVDWYRLDRVDPVWQKVADELEDRLIELSKLSGL